MRSLLILIPFFAASMVSAQQAPAPPEQPAARAVLIEMALDRAFGTVPADPQHAAAPAPTASAFPTPESLRALIPVLQRERVDVVVLHVRIHDLGPISATSLRDVKALDNALHDELAPRVRLVAWIETAVGTAATPLLGIAEHYYKPQGIFGALLPHKEDLSPVSGRELFEWLKAAELMSARVGRNPAVHQAMFTAQPLSADGHGNNTVFRPDDRGEHILNQPDRILTLNSQEALRFGLARAVVPDKEALARALGLTTLEWVQLPQPAPAK
jgi:hypothetical protein